MDQLKIDTFNNSVLKMNEHELRQEAFKQFYRSLHQKALIRKLQIQLADRDKRIVDSYKRLENDSTV